MPNQQALEIIFKDISSTLSDNTDLKEYKISKIVVKSALNNAHTNNFINMSADYKCDKIDTFKVIMNEAYPQFKQDMLICIRDTTIESGVHYLFEDKFETFYALNHYLATQMLQRFLRDFYDNTKIVKAVLHIVSHYTYEELGEEFQYPILSLIGHKDKGIKKFALKVFDNWDTIETLPLLNGTDELRERWLNEYKGKIIKRLEGKQTNAIFFASNQQRKLA